jgi:serine O-acetyltransferase
MIFTLIVKKLGGYHKLRELHNRSRYFKKLYKFLQRAFEHETGSYISLDAVIKGEMNLPHGTYGIFISGGARIGVNCTVYQQVTIGSNTLVDSKGFGAPKIGDNCVIGAGAKLVGNITVGNNCRIGANCVVAIDIPDNSVVALGKPMVIQKENLVNKVYTRANRRWVYWEGGRLVPESDSSVLAKLNR